MSEHTANFTCKVRAAGLTDPPQDCNWPFCGCDPYTDKVMEAVEDKWDANQALIAELVETNADLMAALGRFLDVTGTHSKKVSGEDELTGELLYSECDCEFCQCYEQARAVLGKVKNHKEPKGE